MDELKNVILHGHTVVTTLRSILWTRKWILSLLMWITKLIPSILNKLGTVQASVNAWKFYVNSQFTDVVDRVNRQLEVHTELATQIVESQADVRREVDRVRDEVSTRINDRCKSMHESFSSNVDLVQTQVDSIRSRIDKLERQPIPSCSSTSTTVRSLSSRSQVGRPSTIFAEADITVFDLTSTGRQHA